MKARMGRIRMDPFAGFQQYIVAGARFINSSANILMERDTPESRRLGVFQRTPRSVGENLFTNKFSPMARLAWDLANAKVIGGRRIGSFGENIDIGKSFANSFVPIFMEDMYELAKDEPDFFESIGIPPAVLFGVGMQVYEREQNEKEGFRFRKF
jgi:hypothetical protein